ncbi:MAG: replication factor C large subunit [Nanoarchaeota archaeon]
MKLPFTEKYRVACFDDIKGHGLEIKEVDNFYKKFPEKRALILNGPVGTGKTSLAIALANKYNLELFELNASDLRNRASLERVLEPVSSQDSLFKKGKLILMDEVEGITTSDRGGLPELIALITKAKFPIMLTANNIWHKKFSLLRQKCKIISLKELKDQEIIDIIKNVLRKENKSVNDKLIELIVKQARGDVRAALNDLQSVLNLGEEIFISEISEREKQENIFNLLKKLFQEETDEKTLNIFDNSELELDELLLWVEENLPLEYEGKVLAKAIDSLSKADIFKGRIYRQQYWRFLVYENFFLSAGISAVKKIKNKKFVNYKRPSRILKIWLANQKNAKINSVIEKYAKFCHLSKKKATKEKFLLPLILNNLDKKTKQRMDFNKKDEEFLKEKSKEILLVMN